MTQTPFKRYDSLEDVQAVEQSDLIPSIERNQQKLANDLEKYNSDLFTIEMAAAKRKDDILPTILQIAPKAAKFMAPAIEAHNTRQDQKASDEAQRILSESPEFFQFNYDPKESEEIRIEAGHEAIVDDNLLKGLISPSLALELMNESPGMRNRVKRVLLRERAKAYPGGFVQGASLEWPIRDKDGNEVRRRLEDAKDDFERNQIITKINRAWRRPFSNKEWDQAMVYKYLTSEMEKYEANRDQVRTIELENNYKDLKQERRIASVIDVISYGGVGYQTYLQNNVGKFSWAGKDAMKMARLQLIEDLGTIAKDERFHDLDKLESGLFKDELEWKGSVNKDGSPKLMTFAERFQSDVEPLNRIIENAKLANMQEIRLEDDNRKNNFEAAYIKLKNDKWNSDTEDKELTAADYRGIKAQWFSEFPNEPLPLYLTNAVTREDRIDKADQSILNSLFRDSGVIYSSDTAGMSFATQKWAENKYGDRYITDGGTLAQQYAAIAGEAHTQIDNQVNEHFLQLTGDLKDTEEIGEARRQAKLDFEPIFWKHYFGDAESGVPGKSFADARIGAMTEIRNNIAENKYSLKTKPDSPSEGFKRKRANAHRVWKENPQNYKNELIGHTNSDIAVLKKIQAGIQGINIPEIYRYYANLNPKLNLDAWDVADAQLKLWEKENNLPIKGLGRPPLTKQYVESLTSPLEKAFLKSRTSYSRTSRVMIEQSDGDFNDPEVVYEGALLP